MRARRPKSPCLYLAIQADRGRTGCGTALIDTPWVALKAEGITRCQAYVPARNLTVIQFWEAYQPVLRRDLDLVSFKLA